MSAAEEVESLRNYHYAMMCPVAEACVVLIRTMAVMHIRTRIATVTTRIHLPSHVAVATSHQCGASC